MLQYIYVYMKFLDIHRDQCWYVVYNITAVQQLTPIILYQGSVWVCPHVACGLT